MHLPDFQVSYHPTLFVVCMLFVFFSNSSTLSALFQFVESLQSFFIYFSIVQIVSNICIICFISTILGTCSPNSADVPLSNTRTKHTSRAAARGSSLFGAAGDHACRRHSNATRIAYNRKSHASVQYKLFA